MIVTLWAAMIVGTALWGYGLFITGHPPLIDWTANTPWWIANYLPNMELELGLVLVCIGSSCALLAAQALRSQAKVAPKSAGFWKHRAATNNGWREVTSPARGGSYKQARRNSSGTAELGPMRARHWRSIDQASSSAAAMTMTARCRRSVRWRPIEVWRGFAALRASAQHDAQHETTTDNRRDVCSYSGAAGTGHDQG